MKKIHFDLVISSIVLIAMIVVILIQVGFRLAGAPLSWTEEVARWLLVWSTFGGASYAFKNGGLIRVDFFVKKLLGKNGRKVTDVAAMLFMVLYFVLLGVSACSYMRMTIEKNQTYPITRAPYAITLISLIYCGLSCCVFAVKEARKAYRGKDGPDAGAKVEPDAGAKVKPDAGAKVGPDAGPKIEPDAGPKVGPDAGPKIEPDAGPKVDPDAEPKVGPEVGPKVQPKKGGNTLCRR